MYLGQVVETGRLGEVIGKPRHPYLQALLSAVPVPDPKKAREKRPLPLRSLELPDPTKPPSGCRFHPRCPYAKEICVQEIPTLRPLDGRQIACHLAERIPEWHLL
jgi:peptide/nickel transport system ATP-binding protein